MTTPLAGRGFDALRGEADTFARRLLDARNIVIRRRYEDRIHGCLWMDAAIGHYHDLIRHIAKEARPELAP